MRTVVIGLVVIAGLALFGYYKVMAEKKAELARMERRLKEQKIELARQEKLRKAAELEAAGKAAEKQARIETLKRELAAEEAKLTELKAKLVKAEEQLKNSFAPLSSADVPLKSTKDKINILKREIASRRQALETYKRFSGDEAYVCYDMCIKDANIKFERKMPQECRSVVPGGIYYCLHRSRRSTRRRKDHIRRRNEHRYRNDDNYYRKSHQARVSFECSLHNILWTEEKTADYKINYVGSARELDTAQRKITRELDTFCKELDRQQEICDAAAKKKADDARIEESGKRDLKKQISGLKLLIAESERNISNLKLELARQ